jgi:hypothetical protein
MNLTELANVLKDINTQTTGYASKTINLSLTIRNWVYGYYIQEYELNGSDRGKYGGKAIENLSKLLEIQGVGSSSTTHLKFCRQFYNIYPSIGQTVFDQLTKICPSLPVKISSTLLSQSVEGNLISSERLLNSLSYSHFLQLLKIDNPTKRSFYELECINGSWSVSELNRQINSLYYERSGLSKNKAKLSEISHAKAEIYKPLDVIRDPYIFEVRRDNCNDIAGKASMYLEELYT